MTLIDEPQEWQVRIIVQEINLYSKTATNFGGYAISSLVTRTADTNVIEILTASLPLERQKLMRGLVRDAVKVEFYSGAVSGPTDLKSVCESIVTDIDSLAFEPERQMHRSAQKFYDDDQKKKKP